jgi:hypothetical protein
MLAGEGAPHPKSTLEAPIDGQAAFENTIRACAEALGEDADDLLRLAQGTTPLARLTRLLMGEQHPTARVSRDQLLYKLHETLRREGLRGRALWDEVVRRNPDIQTDSARRAVGRYRKHLRDLAMPESLSEVFTPEFSIDKAVKPRGPKPKKKDRA